MIGRKTGDGPPGPPPPKVAALIALCALLSLAGCGAAGTEGGGIREGSRDPETVVELRPLDGSGTTGTVAVVPGEGGGTEVRLSLEGLPDREGVYVGAVYRGSCPDGADDQGNLPGYEQENHFVHGDHGDPEDEENVIQPLTSVASDPDGKGSSVTPLPTPAEELLSGTPKYIDVHGTGEAIACADLPVASA